MIQISSLWLAPLATTRAYILRKNNNRKRTEMKTGVKLLLESETQIPDWMIMPNFEVGDELLNGRSVCSLKVRRGEASFLPNGDVNLKMPRLDELGGPFLEMRVLEIRNLKDNLIERSPLLCIECGTLTGRMNGCYPNDDGVFFTNFECKQCERQWDWKQRENK